MKRKRSPMENRQMDMPRIELMWIVNPDNPIVQLAATVDWERLNQLFGETFCPGKGRPAISTRLMVALHFLKGTYNLSNKEVLATWLQIPNWQYFTGMKWFTHELPIHPSSMTRWRKRIRQADAQQLLQEIIQAGLAGLKLNSRF